jgi:hypothetical protein
MFMAQYGMLQQQFYGTTLQIFGYILWLYSMWEATVRCVQSMKVYLLSGYVTHISYIKQSGCGLDYETVFDLEHKNIFAVICYLFFGKYVYSHFLGYRQHYTPTERYQYKVIASRTIRGELLLNIIPGPQKPKALLDIGKYDIDIKDVVYINVKMYNGKLIDVTQYAKDIIKAYNTSHDNTKRIYTDVIFVILENFYRLISKHKSFCTELYIMDGYSFNEYIYKKFDIIDM